MKKINHFLEKIGFFKFILLLFLVGFLIGIFISIGFHNYFFTDMKDFYDEVIYNLKACEIEYGRLFWEIVVKEFGSYFLLLLFCISILGIPYIIWYLIYKGILWGVFMGMAVFLYGIKGVLAGLVYGFPHWIFIVPVLAATLHKGYYMSINGPKKKAFTEQIPSICVLMGILLIGCLLEAFVNARILKEIFIWCSE